MTSWIRHNIRLKLVAFVLAVFTWSMVNSLTNDRQVVDGVPLEIRVPPGETLVRQSAERLSVEIRGTRDDMRQVSRQNLQAVLDLSRSPETGVLVRRLRLGMIRHPRWVQPVEVSPAEVTVMIDRTIERELPIAAQFTGELPAGHTIERVLLRPDKVRLSGPESVLDKLTQVKTLPIDVAGRQTSFRERVELVPVNLGKDLSDRRWVEVDVRIRTTPVDTAPNDGVEEKPANP